MRYLLICTCCIGLLFSCSQDDNKEVHKAEVKRGKDNLFAIARDPTWGPIDLYGKASYLSAFVDDFCYELSSVEKLRLSLFPATYSDMFEQLQRGTYEGVISSMVPSDSNKEKFVFSDPIIFLGPTLVVREESKAKSVADMQGLILLVPNNNEVILSVSQSPSIIIKTYSNVGDALMQLIAHKADGALIGNIAATTYTEGVYRDQLKVVTTPLTDLALRLIAPASTPRGKELVKYFNEGLRILKENGVYYYLKRKWNLRDKFE